MNGKLVRDAKQKEVIARDFKDKVFMVSDKTACALVDVLRLHYESDLDHEEYRDCDACAFYEALL